MVRDKDAGTDALAFGNFAFIHGSAALNGRVGRSASAIVRSTSSLR